MEFRAELREALGVVDRGVRLVDQRAHPRDVRLGGVLGGEFGGEAFDGALRVHDLGGADAGEVELHGERLGEQPRVAARDPRAAPLAHLDLDDAQRLERAQRVARDDARRRRISIARSFSVPRKSPGLSFLPNSASRTSLTICDDSEPERPGKKIRPGSEPAMAERWVVMALKIPQAVS